jgi:ATP-dependent DNA helicase RecG
LLSLQEDHFFDVKAKDIKPSKLQETFVAFANADGGDLYLGIHDPSVTEDRLCPFKNKEEANDIIVHLLERTTPSVENITVEFLELVTKDYLLHIFVPKSPKVHYTEAGDCFIRVNAGKIKIKGERITQLAYSKGSIAYERQFVQSLEVSDITESPILSSYIKRVESSQKPEIFLRKQRLLSENDSVYRPNVCCALLFDETPQASLDTRCAVKVYRLRTTETEYKRDQLAEMPITINGPVEQVILDSIQQVQKYLDGVTYHDNGVLVKLAYPTDAIKEIVVNAVIHRDYSLNDDIHIKVFDNRIEVSSPGKLPGYMSIDNLYTDRFSRNPNMVRMLHNLPDPLNHDIGEGLDTVKNELRKAGLVEPAFHQTDNAFVVTIMHQRVASIESAIIAYLESNPKATISNKTVRGLSGEDDINKVKSALQKLRAEGKIDFVDPNASVFKRSYKRTF